MKYIFSCATAFLFLVFLCAEAGAHRVNIFASLENGGVRVECGFSKNRKVRNGRIIVTDAASGVQILEGLTDEGGIFSFRPPEDFLRSGHDLRVSVEAGEGHRNEWTISASELQEAFGGPLEPALAPDASPRGGAARPPLEGGPAAPEVRSLSGPSEQALEAAVGRALDAKLAPIHRALAQMQERGPDFRDIAGGIGWILGLLGLAAYCRYRPRDRSS